MKEYFSHDYHAKDDPKIIKLIQKEGFAGYGLYWAIVEMLYSEGGYMQLDCDCISFALRIEAKEIDKIIKNYDLFKVKGQKFYSESVLKRLKLRQERSEVYRQNSLKRWEKSNKDKADMINKMSMQ